MSNPTTISPRFEIRPLGPEHIEWANAIHCHSNTFLSPVWPNLYPELPPWSILDFFSAFDHLIRHQVESGLSYGIFDTEYKFKNPESAKTGGKLYWQKPTTDAEREATTQASLLEQMDFPLVSIALSYDAFHPLNMEKMMQIFSITPSFPFIMGQIDGLDTNNPDARTPSGPCQIVQRNSTATREDYNGKGLMKILAYWLMHELAGKGYKGIKIESFSDAVFHVWTHPPQPYKAEVVSQINLKDFAGEVESLGETCTLNYVDQKVSRIYVALE
ncbi:hypothetical protein ACJ73_08265 [Blastomyces percursus]|uniref:N-acetyltransferase domain-containing protein n=1 Tax=Blastomyces percursus TaxID=1658174 RepID=A0A1J9PVJ1_9EURO|nr:hypothetical protein ACJ73_08265 [Blastomyces percursus]